MLRKIVAAATIAGLLAVAAPAVAGSTQAPLKDVHWSFESPFGMYDQEQLQRGFKVYKEVCSACHSLNQLAFRNLGDPGGPFWKPKVTPTNNPFVKAIAKDYQISDIDPDSGDAMKRPGVPADYFPSPFANAAAARAANGGAVPPDMSLLSAAREGGPAYIYSVVTGDGTEPPKGLTVPDGKYYDPWMSGDVSSYFKNPGHKTPKGGFIAMPPPLIDDRVAFDDGTKATKEQEAKDVSAFLQWASDPHMQERKTMGLAVITFMLAFAGILYASYRTIWRDISH